MKVIEFTKYVASGNDFIIVEKSSLSKSIDISNLAKKICDRKFGIGADGLLVVSFSKEADFTMRIFNSDGSEANMCGNGARAVSVYTAEKTNKNCFKIKTNAGIVEAKVNKNLAKIKLTEPKDLKEDIPIKIGGRILKVNYINTGVPHTVIFVHDIDKIDVKNLGRLIRWHKNFAPEGTNVDFVEILSENFVKVRTYERGVEDETLSCGTGAVASSLIASCKINSKKNNFFKVLTKGGEILKVYFKKEQGDFFDIWLEGLVNIICKGVYYV